MYSILIGIYVSSRKDLFSEKNVDSWEKHVQGKNHQIHYALHFGHDTLYSGYYVKYKSL